MGKRGPFSQTSAVSTPEADFNQRTNCIATREKREFEPSKSLETRGEKKKQVREGGYCETNAAGMSVALA